MTGRQQPLLNISLYIGIFLFWTSASRAITLKISSPSGILRETFEVEQARTEEERHKGLMFRKTLLSRGGMLFVLPQPQKTSFWMKNTLVSLDVLFLDTSKTITKIHHNAQSLSLEKIESPDKTAYVLELMGGECRKKGIEVRDIISSKGL